MASKAESPAAETTARQEMGRALGPVEIDAWQTERARRAAAREAKKDKLDRCLDAKFAAKCESEKPNYRWTVEATWTAPDRDNGDAMTKMESKQTVIAQNEGDAWALFCDKIGKYPNRNRAKVRFVRGRQVTVSELVSDSTEEKTELPKKTIGPARKPKANLYSSY